MAFLIAAFLHSIWPVEQQQSAQFEQETGTEQLTHEVSAQPQVPHEDDANDNWVDGVLAHLIKVAVSRSGTGLTPKSLL